MSARRGGTEQNWSECKQAREWHRLLTARTVVIQWSLDFAMRYCGSRRPLRGHLLAAALAEAPAPALATSSASFCACLTISPSLGFQTPSVTPGLRGTKVG